MRTLEEVRQLGMEALARALGPVDFVRFLQLFEIGKGNYTEERHEWLDGIDGETIYRRILDRRRELPKATRQAPAGEVPASPEATQPVGENNAGEPDSDPDAH